jgi:hypothetical protein
MSNLKEQSTKNLFCAMEFEPLPQRMEAERGNDENFSALLARLGVLDEPLS